MKNMASTDAKTNFGALLDAAQRGPVTIEKKGRPVSVMLSYEDYEDYRDYEQAKLQWIQKELDVGLAASKRGDVVDGRKAVAKILARNAKRIKAKK
jgi:prevent-host-death family protein